MSALPPHALVSVLHLNSGIFNGMENIKRFSKNSEQLVLTFQLYLDKKIFVRHNNGWINLRYSPWSITALPSGHIWHPEILERFCSPLIREVITVAVSNPHKKGLLIKKKFPFCTREELKEEIWHQIKNEPNLIDGVCVEGGNGLEDVNILDIKVWPSFSRVNNKWVTSEPKWSNNINTRQYRPKTRTNIRNFFLSGSWIDTTTSLNCMEGAVESGKMTAIEICKNDKKNVSSIFYVKKTRMFPLLTALRNLDKSLNGLGLPSLLSIVITVFVLFIVLSVTKPIFSS